MKLHGVESMPSSLVTCFVQDLEVHIVELAYEGFSFRVPKKLERVEAITLHFLQFEQSSYHSVVLEEFKIELEEQQFYVIYTILTKQNDYVRYTQAAIKQYGQYISLKLSGDDGYLSEEMVGYPAEEDASFYPTFEEQKKDWFGKSEVKSELEVDLYKTDQVYELALGVDNPKRYEQYLSMDIQAFSQKVLEENYLDKHPMFHKQVKRLYIGNQFCHNLLPEPEQLIALMDKVRQEALGITLVFTYLRDEFVEDTTALLESIIRWCRKKSNQLKLW